MKMIKTAALTLALSSQLAFGSFDEADFPNNTETALASQYTRDGIVTVESGYHSQHLYGRDLVLELTVANLAAAKEIYIVRNGGGYGNEWQALYAEDYYNLNAAASWKATSEENRDRILVRVKGHHFPGAHYSVYVVMNGQTYENSFSIFTQTNPSVR